VARLIDVISSRVTPEVVQKLASLARIGPTDARRAIDGICAAQLDGLVTMGSTATGASRLLDVLQRHSGTESFGHVLAAGEQLQTQARAGGTMQSAVYGADLGRRTECVASSLRIPQGAASQLMELIMPTAVGLLAKEVRDRGLDAAGLGRLLRDDRTTIRRALPAGLADCLDRVPAVEPAVTTRPAAAAPVRTRTSPWLWLLPLLLLAALALWYLSRPVATTGLAGTRWQWERTTLRDGSERRPANPGAYVLDFQRDGTVAVTSDCNTGKASHATDGGNLAIKELTATTNACPGQSLSDVFVQQLRNAGTFAVRDNRLTVNLRDNSGTMEFVPVR
jgi:heat shock protein HslJ